MTDGSDGAGLARACAVAMLARDRAAQGFGIAIEESRAGYARLSMTIGDTMINGHGTAHGGVIFTLADTAFAFACNSRDVPHVALDATISFIAPTRSGDRLEAVAQERSLRGRTGVYDITIAHSSGASFGDVVAVFRGTAYRVQGSVLAGRDAERA